MKTIVEYIDGQLQEHADVAPVIKLTQTIFDEPGAPSLHFIDERGAFIEGRMVSLCIVKRVTFETA